MPQKIIIVRHGETQYNKERRIQGWVDVPLNETGREQARATAQKLASVAIDAVYSSDLKRAHETASIIASTIKKELQTTKALRERDIGIFAGWSWEREPDEAKNALWAEFETAREQEDLYWNKHQGESLHDVSSRLSLFMSTLHTNHIDQSVLIVTHGGTINRILEQYKVKVAKDGFRMIKNGSILILHKQNTGYTLEEM